MFTHCPMTAPPATGIKHTDTHAHGQTQAKHTHTLTWMHFDIHTSTHKRTHALAQVQGHPHSQTPHILTETWALDLAYTHTLT